MAAKDVFVVQAFEMHRKKIVPTTKEQAKNERQAELQAANVAQRKGGAVALALTVDDETGEVERSRVIARFGEVPEDLDQLLEGM